MINFSSWAIRQPLPSILLFIVLCLMGIYHFNTIKVQDFPDIDVPLIRVDITWQGATPEQLETEVVRKIENSIAGVQGLNHTYATILYERAVVTAKFSMEKSGDEAQDDIRNAVSRIRSNLPANIREPVITKIEFSQAPILAYSIRSDHLDEEALSWYIDNTLNKTLLAVEGVGTLTRVGGVDREIAVTLQPDALLAWNLSPVDLSRQLGRYQQDASGGRSNIGAREQSIRTLASATSVQALQQMPVTLSDGRMIWLDQVATVRDTIAERRSDARLNDQQTIAIELTRSLGSSPITLRENIDTALQQIQKDSPGLHIEKIFDLVEPTQDNYQGSLFLLLEGALLAVLVVWWFLRDWRSTFIACVALPLSVIPTFMGMYYFDFSLNMVTLLALGLVIGILVDDAIVEIENIVRHLNAGKTPYQAAMEAADEIGLAVIATTFTLIAVFLPTAFMDGIPGKFFKQFGWTASIAVFASLVVARLLTPMMAAYLLKPATASSYREPGWIAPYLRMTQWCLYHRFWVLLLSTIFFMASLSLIAWLPTGFIPPDDISQTLVTIELAPGSRLEDTRAKSEEARKLLMGIPEVKHIYTAIGAGSVGLDVFKSGNSNIHIGKLSLALKARKERQRSKQYIEKDIRNRLKTLSGVRISVGLGRRGERYQMAIKSDDGDLLLQTDQMISNALRQIEGVGSIISNASLQRPEITIQPNPVQAAVNGITTASIADTVRVATTGDYHMALPQWNLPQRQVPIRVKMAESVRYNLDQLRQLPVLGKRGVVRLEQIADVKLSSGPVQINHYDRKRNIVYDVELGNLPLGDLSKQINQLPILQQLPSGVERVVFGDAEEMAILFGSFLLAILIGIICIYIVLVLLFYDAIQPIAILAALPLSIGGAFIALLITNSSFSMPSLIGLIMLMGIATKNSILLVEYAIVARRDRGFSRHEALMDACRKRARPIIMTTIAMGAGMLPIAIGIGVDPAFRAPMAIAVIGGLLSSTFLSLLVIPVIYTIMDDIHQGLRRLFFQNP